MVEEIDDDRRVVAAATADPTGPPMRASDAERAAVADRLHAALAQGRLDIGETEDRLAAADAARHRSDLQPLVADLPAAEARALAAGWRRVWQLIVEQVWLSSAAARGSQPVPPDRRQRRAATAPARHRCGVGARVSVARLHRGVARMTRLPKALRGGRARRVLVVAAVFAAVTAAGGGAGLVLGRVAAVGAEHAHVGASLHQEGDGVDGPWRAGDADNP